MLRSILTAAALAALLAAPASSAPLTLKPADGARLIPVSSGTCITMDPDEKSGFTLTNSCNECRAAVVSSCDGEPRVIEVHANSSIHIGACKGIQNLLSDAPCEHR